MGIFSILFFAAGVFLSWKFCAGYWVVGPVFAAEVFLIRFKELQQKNFLKYLVFTAASTVIYAMVFRIADKAWRFQPEWLDMLAGSATAAVAMGSVLMVSVHAFLFGTDLKTARSAALTLIASWYLVMLASSLDAHYHWTSGDYYGLLAIALWQGIYVLHLKLR